MITLKHLHAYKKLSDKGLIPAFVCPMDSLHEEIFPWEDEDGKVCLWCIYCNSKVYLGEEREKFIMELLHQ